MSRLVRDRVQETTTTTGTGNITLAGAVSQYESFDTGFGIGPRFVYVIKGQSGTEWECGYGHLSGATTLVRSSVIQSSNSDALVSFAAGTKDVFSDVPAVLVVSPGAQLAMARGWAKP